MGAPNPKAFNGMYMLLGFLGVGCALAIIIIIDQQLWTYIGGYVGWYSYVVVQDDCYLGWTGGEGSSTNLCYFNWTTAAIGAFLWLVIWFMAICTKNPAGKSSGPFAIMFFLAVVVWATAGGVNSANIPDANAQGAAVAAETGTEDTLTGWRNSILALSWVAFGLSILGLLASVMDTAKNKPGMQQQQQPQFYAGGPPPQGQMYGAPPPPGAPMYGAPPPGQAYGAPPPMQNYPPAGPPPPTFYPAPGAGGAPPTGAYQPPPAGYPPAAQF